MGGARSLDEDNFHNLSFHSDQNTPGGSSSAGGGFDAGSDSDSHAKRQQHQHQIESGDASNIPQLDPEGGSSAELLECTVTEPHTENAGTKDAYVSYLITTNVRRLF